LPHASWRLKVAQYFRSVSLIDLNVSVLSRKKYKMFQALLTEREREERE